MKFIDLGYSGRNLINFDLVKKVSLSLNEEDHRDALDVVFSDGTEERYEGHLLYRMVAGLKDLSATVIPAAPGFELLDFWFYGADPYVATVAEPNVAAVLDQYYRSPIVAWRITQLGPEPIGILGSRPNSDEGMEAILRPDGVVIQLGSQPWRDTNAWAEDVVEKWKEWRTEPAA